MVIVVPCEHCGSREGMDLARHCVMCRKFRPPSSDEALREAVKEWQALDDDQRAFLDVVCNVTKGGAHYTMAQVHAVDVAQRLLRAASVKS